jgi:hypothetical protein
MWFALLLMEEGGEQVVVLEREQRNKLGKLEGEVN